MIKKNQLEALQLKSTTEMRNSLEDFNSRFQQAEERNIKLEDMSIQIIQSEDWKGKRLKKNKKSLTDL